MRRWPVSEKGYNFALVRVSHVCPYINWCPYYAPNMGQAICVSRRHQQNFNSECP